MFIIGKAEELSSSLTIRRIDELLLRLYALGYGYLNEFIYMLVFGFLKGEDFQH